jgi:hypothetical protein
MKHCTFVPHVVSPRLELSFRDIGDEPVDFFRKDGVRSNYL